MKRYFRHGALGLISLFFLFAGLSKLVDPAAFSHSISAYQLTGPLFSWVLALWIPWIEVLAALFLWLRHWRTPAAIILAGLLLVFQVALLGAAVRGLDISCGCLGSAIDTGIFFAFFRNLVLLALLAVIPGLKGRSA